MITISEIRKKYPQYDDLSDEQLADSLHKKYYSDMPKDEFISKIAMQKQPPDQKSNSLVEALSGIGNLGFGLGKGVAQGVSDFGISAANLIPQAAENFFGFNKNPTAIAGLSPRQGFESGVTLPRIPHPNFLNPNPESTLESAGQTIGNIGSGLLLPGAGAYRGAKATEGILSKLLSGATQGAALGYAGNEDNRGIGALTGALTGSLGSIPAVASALKSAYKNPFHLIQEAHDTQDKFLSKIFSDVSKEAKKSDIKIEIPKKLLKEISETGAPTKAFDALLNKAKKGDYDSLRKLQHELFLRGKSKRSSGIPSESDMGDLIFEQRDELNGLISNALHARGRSDLAEQLDTARQGWRELENTFYSNPTIAKLVGAKREVPLSFSTLRKQSTSNKNLQQAVEGLDERMKLNKKSRDIAKLITAIGVTGGLAGGIKNLLNSHSG